MARNPKRKLKLQVSFFFLEIFQFLLFRDSFFSFQAIPAIRTVMNPFLLRRLKDDVLNLPAKKRYRIGCSMSTMQKEAYEELVRCNKAQVEDPMAENKSVSNILMELRKAANHPLLLDHRMYNDEQIEQIARVCYRQVEPYYDQPLDKGMCGAFCSCSF